jgi:hypothetical protein
LSWARVKGMPWIDLPFPHNLHPTI